MSKNLWIFIQLVFAYEWLVSGINKVMTPHYLQAFHKALQSSQIQYGFYANLVKSLVLPHSNVFAVLVAVGELAVGLGLVLVSLLMARRANGPALRTLGVVTNIIGAFMTLNFFFYQNGAYFIRSGDPFDEGLPIDFVMTLVQAGLAVGFMRMNPVLRARRGQVDMSGSTSANTDASADVNAASNSNASKFHIVRHERSESLSNSR